MAEGGGAACGVFRQARHAGLKLIRRFVECAARLSGGAAEADHRGVEAFGCGVVFRRGCGDEGAQFAGARSDAVRERRCRARDLAGHGGGGCLDFGRRRADRVRCRAAHILAECGGRRFQFVGRCRDGPRRGAR